MLIDVTAYTSPSVAARMIGRSARRVQQLADAGVLKSVRAPHGRLVELEAVRLLAERYAATRRTPPAALPVDGRGDAAPSQGQALAYEPEPTLTSAPISVSAPVKEPSGPVSDQDVRRLLDGLRRSL